MCNEPVWQLRFIMQLKNVALTSPRLIAAILRGRSPRYSCLNSAESLPPLFSFRASFCLLLAPLAESQIRKYAHWPIGDRLLANETGYRNLLSLGRLARTEMLSLVTDTSRSSRAAATAHRETDYTVVRFVLFRFRSNLNVFANSILVYLYLRILPNVSSRSRVVLVLITDLHNHCSLRPPLRSRHTHLFAALFALEFYSFVLIETGSSSKYHVRIFILVRCWFRNEF